MESFRFKSLNSFVLLIKLEQFHIHNNYAAGRWVKTSDTYLLGMIFLMFWKRFNNWACSFVNVEFKIVLQIWFVWVETWRNIKYIIIENDDIHYLYIYLQIMNELILTNRIFDTSL